MLERKTLLQLVKHGNDTSNKEWNNQKSKVWISEESLTKEIEYFRDEFKMPSENNNHLHWQRIDTLNMLIKHLNELRSQEECPHGKSKEDCDRTCIKALFG